MMAGDNVALEGSRNLLLDQKVVIVKHWRRIIHQNSILVSKAIDEFQVGNCGLEVGLETELLFVC
jgi:hypothetical protein